MAESFIDWTGAKSEGDFLSVPGFLSREHITVVVDNAEVSGTLWEWVSDGQIRVLAGFPSGSSGRVQRLTPTSEDELNELTNNGDYDAGAVNANDRRLLYIMQEAREAGDLAFDARDEAGVSASSAASSASAAAASATAAGDSETAAASSASAASQDADDADAARVAAEAAQVAAEAATPPFPISQVTDLQTALDGKSGTGHGHAITDVTGLQGDLDAKYSAANPPPGGTPSTNWEVGTYGLFMVNGATVGAGATIAGSSLLQARGQNGSTWTTAVGTVPGTWRNMFGDSLSSNNSGLFVRVA